MVFKIPDERWPRATLSSVQIQELEPRLQPHKGGSPIGSSSTAGCCSGMDNGVTQVSSKRTQWSVLLSNQPSIFPSHREEQPDSFVTNYIMHHSYCYVSASTSFWWEDHCNASERPDLQDEYILVFFVERKIPRFVHGSDVVDCRCSSQNGLYLQKGQGLIWLGSPSSTARRERAGVTCHV